MVINKGCLVSRLQLKCRKSRWTRKSIADTDTTQSPRRTMMVGAPPASPTKTINSCRLRWPSRRKRRWTLKSKSLTLFVRALGPVSITWTWFNQLLTWSQRSLWITNLASIIRLRLLRAFLAHGLCRILQSLVPTRSGTTASKKRKTTWNIWAVKTKNIMIRCFPPACRPPYRTNWYRWTNGSCQPTVRKLTLP